MSEWLESITQILDEDDWAVGDKREELLKAAKDLDEKLPPHNPDLSQRSDGKTMPVRLGDMGLRNAFRSWIEAKGYLRVIPKPKLPATMTRSRETLEVEFGTNRVAFLEIQERRIASARNKRIQRCVDALEDGLDDLGAMTFIAAWDEWEEAQKKVRGGMGGLVWREESV